MGVEMAKTYAAFGMDATLPTAWQLDYMIEQVYIVSGIVILVLIYPVVSVFRLNLTRAMRR
jgi:hypothetical protein